MKATVKANIVDKYLYPIRLQITELVNDNSTVIELGCGNGDLLFKLAEKIILGVGIDNSEQLIEYATSKVKKEKIGNLEFKLLDLLEAPFDEDKMDYSITSLLLHILPLEVATQLLNRMLDTSDTLIICGFSQPENMKQKILLWFDQRFTNHYSNFLDYQKNGYTDGLLNSIKNIEYDRINTFDPEIKIYKITKKQH